MVTTSMIVGLVVTPMGWVLVLAGTVAPQWRELSQRPGYPPDSYFYDGLWETCRESITTSSRDCNQLSDEIAASWLTQLNRALCLLSVLLAILGYLVAQAGVRWWTEGPSPNLAALGGVLIVLSGAACLAPVSYVGYRLVRTIQDPLVPPADKYQLGTCLYLGWFGGSAELLGGITLMCNLKCSCRKPSSARERNHYSGPG
ncbi:claudin-7-like [Heptranchias perlo]|uniref:claudin-7-like n=1 Tax=Heptranchias perlo TaxID=212740 RepID=UPI003559590E